MASGRVAQAFVKLDDETAIAAALQVVCPEPSVCPLAVVPFAGDPPGPSCRFERGSGMNAVGAKAPGKHGLFHEWFTQNGHKTFVRETRNQGCQRRALGV